MAALLPSFVVDLETDMQEIVQASYGSLTNELWYPRITKVRTTNALNDILFWMMDAFQIRDEGREGGNHHYEDLISQQTTITHRHAGGGIILKNDQLNDQDGRGLDQAANWSRQAGAYMAYWPQKRTAYFMRNGHTAALFTAYDGVAYFAVNHPVNPGKAAAGTYSNWHKGAPTAASGNTPKDPGACPIDESVSVEVAIQNLGKIFAYLSAIRQPNGEDPRGLRPESLFVSPQLFPRAVQLTNAKMIAQIASSGAGSANIEQLINALGYAQPVMCPELSGFGNDTTYFVGAKQLLSDPFGAIIYTQREPFSINWYTGITDVELARRNELEYLVNGRNSITSGHPYLLHRVDAS